MPEAAPPTATAERRATAMSAALERSQAVIEFTPDGTIRRANPNFLATMGYREEEIVGRHHRMFVDPQEAASPAYAAFWQALGRGEAHTGEFARRSKDGRRVWIHGS